MNRGLNLPQISRIMNEFEKENSMMDMKEEMMSDAVDDVMNDEAEDEEEEGDKILKEVLDEIGVNLSQQVKRLLILRHLQLMHYSSSPMPPLALLSPHPWLADNLLPWVSPQHPQYRMVTAISLPAMMVPAEGSPTKTLSRHD